MYSQIVTWCIKPLYQYIGCQIGLEDALNLMSKGIVMSVIAVPMLYGIMIGMDIDKISNHGGSVLFPCCFPWTQLLIHQTMLLQLHLFFYVNIGGSLPSSIFFNKCQISFFRCLFGKHELNIFQTLVEASTMFQEEKIRENIWIKNFNFHRHFH